MSFSGHAIYKTGFLDDVAEDVSAAVSMISPYETPFLDLVGDAPSPAKSAVHDWLEDELGPNTLVTGSAITSTTGDTVIGINGGLAALLQVGMVLEAPQDPTTGESEQMQISAIVGNSITVTRAFASTDATSYASGVSIEMISDAALDGADVTGDLSRVRPRLTNFTHIFKKDVIISGTSQAVNLLGGIGNEQDHQTQQRLRETLRDLEKAVIRSRLSGNTIGSGSNTRTMRGLLQFLATNRSTYTTTSGSPATQFEDDLTASIQEAWRQGGTDLDLILIGSQVKKHIDQLNASRIRVVNDERKFKNVVYEFENTYGTFALQLNRWIPANFAAIVSTSRIAVLPLNGRSFAYVPVAKTGDSDRGMVIGEYTMEVRNEAGMALAKFPNLSQLLTP